MKGCCLLITFAVIFIVPTQQSLTDFLIKNINSQEDRFFDICYEAKEKCTDICNNMIVTPDGSCTRKCRPLMSPTTWRCSDLHANKVAVQPPMKGYTTSI